MNTLFPWQQDCWLQLSAYMSQDRIPQALLLTGSKGLGKRILALQFAHSLLCHKTDSQQIFCGECPSCKLSIAKTHPDLFLISPEAAGKNITIKQIRLLNSKLALKPQFSGYRVVILFAAEAMNHASANAFLKCLEEPALKTVIILVTDQPYRLPATIVSRCQKLHIPVPVAQISRDWLSQTQTGPDLDLLLSLSNGAPLLAKELASVNMLALRNECFMQWKNIALQQAIPATIAEQWQKLSSSQLITWMSSWVIDLIKCYFSPEITTLNNPDLREPLKELAERLELVCLYKFYDLLLKNKKILDTQINKQLMFEEVLIKWHQSTHIND